MERGLDLGCLIALRCESARRQSTSKIFNFFSKRVLSMFQDSGIIFSKKIFSDFQTYLSPDITMRSQRQKLPLACNQRRQTLPARITWKGEWTSGVSLRCESASLGQKFFQKNFQLFFKTGFVHVSGLWDNFKQKKFFPTFRPI